MSWISGCIVINDTSKKALVRAAAEITDRIRHEADLEEFPNTRCRNLIIVKDKRIFASYESAEDYSDEIYGEWARNYNICIPFKDTSEAKETKKILELKERIHQNYDKRDAYINSHHVKDFKAAYIGCPCCGSKINKEYLGNDHCPACKSELRSETVIKTIQSYDKKILELEKRLQEEKSKQKVPVRYAVFYCEYVG